MIRHLALSLIRKWEREGTYLSQLLQRGIDQDVHPRDRALLTELVYGPVRWRGMLDSILSSFAPRGLDALKPQVREILRQALYQMIFLDRIRHATAVHEAVNLTRLKHPQKLSGFVNGMLRSISREMTLQPDDDASREEKTPSPSRLLSVPGSPEKTWIFARDVFPSPEKDPVRYLSYRWSHPAWLVRRWCEAHGDQTTQEILKANNRTPTVTLRVNRTKVDPDTFQARLAEKDIRFSVGADPHCIVLEHSGRVQELPGFQDGHFQVQDAASQSAALLLDPRPGETILDLCAAPGGKSTHIAEILGDEGRVVAIDISDRRAQRIRENAARLGLTCIQVRVENAMELSNRENESYDRILIDAPCSNTGTLARRPEARWRIEADHIKGLREIQLQLLSRSIDLVRPGGQIVYSTCSIEGEENESVVEEILEQRPDLTLEESHRLFPNHEHDGGFFARLLRSDRDTSS